MIWKASDLVRRMIFRFPPTAKHVVTDIIAMFVYWPLARLSLLFERLGLSVSGIPLSYYRNHSFYTLRTDSRDRFGTPLEQRFDRVQIEKMMISAGLENIQFSESAPFWCVVGTKG